MTPEKLPISRKYFSTEFSPQGNSGAVFFCAWTLLKIWPIDKSAKDQQKILHAEDYPKSYVAWLFESFNSKF